MKESNDAASIDQQDREKLLSDNAKGLETDVPGDRRNVNVPLRCPAATQILRPETRNNQSQKFDGAHTPRTCAVVRRGKNTHTGIITRAQSLTYTQALPTTPTLQW